MKKFLSILLAVMMVLSTVSFAAPSAFVAMDTANAAPVVEVPAEEAELAGTNWDKSGYGKLVYKVDFEQDDFDVDAFGTAYAQVSSHSIASYINPAFDCGNLTTYTNTAGDGFKNLELVTEGGNTYIKGDVNAGYSGFFRLTKYNCAWPEGYYTFVVDVKAPAISSFAKQCNDTAIALTNIHDFVLDEKDVWQTVAYRTTDVVNGANIYGFFVTPNNATAGTVSYDNWEVYYRPATVTLTIAGKEYVVSTDEKVSVASLAADVKAPAGQVLAGLSLTEGGELISDQYFFEDATLYPTFKKDSSIHPEYGKAVYIIDYEKEGIAPAHGVTDASTRVPALTDTYNAALPMNNTFVYLNFATSSGVAAEGGNKYLSTVVKDGYTSYLYLSKWGQDWPEGYYTFSTDVRLGSAVSGRTVQHNNDSSLVTWVKDVDIKKANEWQTVQYRFIGKGGDMTTSFLCFNGATAGVNIDYDNVALYYKPYTADVTLIVNGKEYVAEDVATSGVSADTIVAAAGIEIPYGKKAVLSETFGGESIGNVINLVMDSTYYVSFVADDSITEYGKRLLFIDFEKFDAGYELPDNSPVSGSTDDFHGDWGHLTVNYEVGGSKGVVSDEDGNKIVKGTQGWAQIRIGNANFETAPAGYYTMALKVKNYGTEDKYLSSKDQNGGTAATWVKAGSATGTTLNYPIVNGVWNEVAAELPMATKDFTIYHTAQMTTDVAFDDIALYYRPASVNLTVVDLDGNEIVYEDTDSVVDTDKLLADIPAPFGYRVGLATEQDGEPITGEINLVSDAKLYAVLVEDDRVNLDYGNALFIIDFEKESMQGWDGNSQTLDNSIGGNGVQVFESASYYDPRFENKNYRVRFVINESGANLIDQDIVEDENGNHYTTGTNTTQWSQVVSTNWGNIQGDAGVYTFMYDAKIEETTETNLTMGHGAFHDGSAKVVDGFSAVAGDWDTVVLQVSMDAAGNLPKGTWGNFNFGAVKTTKLSFDNAKLYFKPLYADIEVRANGEVVKTISGVSTETGVTVDRILEGIKVKGYTITGVRFGDKTYVAGETIVAPCDAHVDLVLAVSEIDPATPSTSAEVDLRTDVLTGVRFKAELSKAEMNNVSAFGWIVTRASLLDAEGIAYKNFEVTSNVKMVKGWNYGNGVTTAKIFDENDETAWFTAVLYFSSTEDDGYPAAERLADKLVARPVAVVDGEYLYGDATAPVSMYDVAVALWEDAEAWDSLDEDTQVYLDGLCYKVEESGLEY